MRSPRVQGIAYTLVASLLWSTSFTATGVGLRYTDPYTLVFLRFVAAAAVLVPFLALSSRGPRVLSLLRTRKVWGLGAVYAGAFALQYLGQDMTSASAATVISNLFPVVVPPLAFFALRERAGVAQTAALALGLLGLAMFALPDSGAGAHSIFGDLALAGAAIGYAFFIVLSKKHLSGDAADSSFAITLTLAPLLSLPLLALATPTAASFALGEDAWVAVAWMGTAGSILPLALYLRGLERIPASLSGMLLLSELIFGVVLAIALLSESLHAWQWAGTAAISVAVLISSAAANGAQAKREAGSGVTGAGARSVGEGDASRTEAPRTGPAQATSPTEP